jgi:hypothetical protein
MKPMDWGLLTFVLFVLAAVAIPRMNDARVSQCGPPPLTVEEFEQLQDEISRSMGEEIKHRPVKKCECIECGCGADCKCEGGKCACQDCKPVPSVPPSPAKVRSYYAIAYQEAMEGKCRLCVFNGVPVRDMGGSKGVAVMLDGNDPDFKLPKGVYVYEFKSDGRRPAGLYGGLYSGASSRPGAEDRKSSGPVYSCGPGGCRRIR